MNELEFPLSFGEWLKARRKALDLTQEELAKRSACTVFALRKIESGERRPSKQLAGLLATALEIAEEDKAAFIRVARGELSSERLRGPALDASPVSSPDPQSGPHHLPLPPNPLLGRETELAALERLFKDVQCRLLTLTGMGGIGKTRLAIEFALRYYAMFPGGVYYVPLASLNSAELIVPAIAEALDFTFSGPADPKEQLFRHMAGRTREAVLLVLDNFEHLLALSNRAAELVADILRRWPNCRILTTSRERLNLQGEWMYELHGLPVPAAEFLGSLEEYSAAALFIQRARRAASDFEVTAEAQAALVQICRLLEGIPLAIELAAVWVGTLTCQEIAREIESDIGFLETRMRDVPERHRSLRASFEHSWRLLSDSERTALCRLAIFRGGFDRTAAEQVAKVTLPLLASLMSKSLVRRAESGRYDLHEVIRQFALAHLDEDPSQLRDARDAHSEYYLGYAAEREKALRSSDQLEAARELTNELDNLRAAWVWAIRREKFSILGASVRSLGWFFEVTGLIREGIDQFEPLVRSLKSGHQNDEWQWVLGQALAQQALLCFRKGLFDRAQSLLEQSLSILRPLGKPHLLIDALIYLGVILQLGGDLQRSQSLFEEGLACARSAGDKWFEAYAIYNLGYLDSLMGNYRNGYREMAKGLEMFRGVGDAHSIALALNFLVPTLVKLERYEAAKCYMAESITLCEQTKNRWGMGTAYRYLGLANLAEGGYMEAQAHLRKSLEVFGGYIVGWDIARSLIYLGDSMMMSGSLADARKTYLEALYVAKEAKSVPLMLDALLGMAQFHLKTGQDESAFELSSMVLNHASSTGEMKERAHQMSTQAERCLDRETIRMIKMKLSGQSLEETVNNLGVGKAANQISF